MLFYLYVSQTKVDMLFHQLGKSDAKTIQTRSSISIPKIAEFERTSTQTQNASLFEKLDKVLNHLAETGQLVTFRKLMEGPDSHHFAVDSGPWKALLLGKDYLIANNLKLLEDEKNRPAPTSYAVFCSRPGALIFLVGSPIHVLGMDAKKETFYTVVSPSYTVDNYILSLKEGNDVRPDRIVPGAAQLFAYLWLVPERSLKVCFVIYNRFEVDDALWKEIAKCFEFQGLPSPDRPKIIILGSPLFVALA